MQADINNNISFCSRNPVIRKADDIARYVNKLYPVVSCTKIYSLDSYKYKKYSVAQKYGDYPLRKYNKKLGTLRNLLIKLYVSKKSNFRKCVSYVKAMQKEQKGNCGELSFLARMVAACNGLKNTKIAYLSFNGEAIDHSVVYVDDKNPYIIDSWAGFADYVPKTFEKYCKEYRKLIGINSQADASSLRFKDVRGNYIANDEMQFTDQLVTKLIRKYPELVMNKK